MHLQPDKAVEVYESALKKNPRDAALASKTGQALVKTHQYHKVWSGISSSRSIIRQQQWIFVSASLETFALFLFLHIMHVFISFKKLDVIGRYKHYVHLPLQHTQL